MVDLKLKKLGLMQNPKSKPRIYPTGTVSRIFTKILDNSREFAKFVAKDFDLHKS